jgi:hypothetical protein
MTTHCRSLYDGQKSVSEIIRGSVSTQADLEKLCRKLGLEVTFDWIDNYNPNIKNQIMNIDEDHIGGSHWVAIYDNSHYFDPLGLPIARDRLNYMDYTLIQIQNPTYGACGLYCVLFLYYANHGELDKFYALFA